MQFTDMVGQLTSVTMLSNIHGPGPGPVEARFHLIPSGDPVYPTTGILRVPQQKQPGVVRKHEFERWQTDVYSPEVARLLEAQGFNVDDWQIVPLAYYLQQE